MKIKDEQITAWMMLLALISFLVASTLVGIEVWNSPIIGLLIFIVTLCFMIGFFMLITSLILYTFDLFDEREEWE